MYYYINNYGYYGHYGHYGQIKTMERQSQKQISKSKQIQDQAYSYGVMGNIFSALEWYAKRSSNKNQLKIH